MDDHVDRAFAAKAAFLGWIGAPAAYIFAILYYLEYWACATGAVFIIGSGLFTTKVVLSLKNPWAAFGLAPVFGAAWLILIWLFLKLAG
jgi:hypothetical protein